MYHWLAVTRASDSFFHALIGFRAGLIFRYESPMGLLATICQANRYHNFVSELQGH